MDKNFKKLVIIGAPRSGTNMLRDILCSIDGFDTWPCDEINYIWRYGNVAFPSDELPKNNASKKVQNYIVNAFNKIGASTGADWVVEKTCANSLRVPFVNEVLPEAKYIFIYRDGIDATGSAKLRWTAKLDIPYILEKVRFVPKVDLPYYGFRYLWARLFRLVSREKRLAFWGPALDDMQNVLQNYSLNEVCAIQWQRCVDMAEDALSDMPKDKVVRVRYEDFVRTPETELERILTFLGEELDAEMISKVVSGVSSGSLGKGRKALGDDEVARLESLVGETLKRYDYL